ncbi:MAG: hypothetical protein ACOXZR_03255 [Bacilli bacterium]|jgi:hypothetical protein
MKKTVNLIIKERLNEFPRRLNKIPYFVIPLEDGQFKLKELPINFTGYFKEYLKQNNYKLGIVLLDEEKQRLNKKEDLVKTYFQDENGLCDAKIYELRKTKRKKRR